jgi:hypothetical protein
MKAFLKKYAFLLMLMLVPVLFVGMAFVFSKGMKQKEGGKMWKEVSSPQPQKKPREILSNYERLVAEKNGDPDGKTRLSQQAALRAKNKKYKQTKVEEAKIGNTPTMNSPLKGKSKKSNTSSKGEEKKWFSTISNPELVPEETRYRAVFRESQDIRPGKHVQIVLQDEIPSLCLEAGTILNGLTSLVGERIHIQITSGKVGDKLLSLSQYGLICLDDPTLVEGLYHDDIARMVSEASKKSVTREMLEFAPDELTNKIEKGLSLADITKAITIEKGKQLFVAFSSKQKKKNKNG